MIRSDVITQFDGLRVADVRDGLDWSGMPAKGTVSRDIAPLFEGARLCGPAFTVRSRPSQKQVSGLTSDEYTKWAYDYWHKEVYVEPWFTDLQPGDVIMLESPDLGVGQVGSHNSLAWHSKGAQGAVTSGGVRDVDELRIRQVPVFARYHSQSMTQGRIEYDAADVSVTIGDVLVNPGDIVVADGDGVIVVPLEHAEQVAKYARQEYESDKAGRRRLYQTLGWALDHTVQ